MKTIYCTNCGKKGHVFKKCLYVRGVPNSQYFTCPTVLGNNLYKPLSKIFFSNCSLNKL